MTRNIFCWIQIATQSRDDKIEIDFGNETETVILSSGKLYFIYYF